jgi:LmbE family N-acetylglucosaminyl deacetylase
MSRIPERTDEIGGVRRGETVRDACERHAIDAIYAARDRGGSMHDAGKDAAAVVLEIVLAQYPENIHRSGLDHVT